MHKEKYSKKSILSFQLISEWHAFRFGGQFKYELHPDAIDIEELRIFFLMNAYQDYSKFNFDWDSIFSKFINSTSFSPEKLKELIGDNYGEYLAVRTMVVAEIERLNEVDLLNRFNNHFDIKLTIDHIKLYNHLHVCIKQLYNRGFFDENEEVDDSHISYFMFKVLQRFDWSVSLDNLNWYSPESITPTIEPNRRRLTKFLNEYDSSTMDILKFTKSIYGLIELQILSERAAEPFDTGLNFKIDKRELTTTNHDIFLYIDIYKWLKSFDKEVKGEKLTRIHVKDDGTVIHVPCTLPEWVWHFRKLLIAIKKMEYEYFDLEFKCEKIERPKSIMTRASTFLKKKPEVSKQMMDMISQSNAFLKSLEDQ